MPRPKINQLMFALHSPDLKMVQRVGRKILLVWICSYNFYILSSKLEKNNLTVETANYILRFGLFGGSVEGKKHFIFYCMLSQTKMLVCGMLVTSLPQVCASLLQSKHDCNSKCLWLRMRA